MPSLYLLYRLDGRTVVPELLKLEIKVVEPCDELHLRWVTFDDNELLVEDAFYDKPAAVMLRSCLTKHLLKADILFRGEFEIIPVDSGICRCRASDPLFCGCHQSGSLSGVTRERHPASQSEHLCMPKNFSAYKGTARCYLAITKSAAENFLWKLWKASEGGSFPVQYYNRLEIVPSWKRFTVIDN